MKLTFLGHSCFSLFDGKTHLLIDPFLSGNGKAAAKADEVPADYILLSHCHGDHIGDTLDIARRTGATVCGVAELRGMLTDAGIKNCLGNIGGTLPLPCGSVKMVQAIHGSGHPGALACGFVINFGGVKVYFAGDTALYSDMSFLKEENLDAAILPIGDFFTMGPKDAARAAKLVGAKITVPMHYNTFPAVEQDPNAFAALCEPENKVVVMNPGDSIDL